MSKVRIYTTKHCAYCVRAKHLLEIKGVNYEEVSLDGDPIRKSEVMKEFKWETVPIILIKGKLIGGFDQLASLERKNQLDELLN